MSNINVNNITPLAGTTGTVSISGSLFVSGNIAAHGNLTLGNENTDTITVASEFTSSLIPDVDNAFDLGTTTKRWQHVYAVSSSIDTLIVSGGNTLSNWGNFKNRLPQDKHFFTVTDNPNVEGGWRSNLGQPATGPSGSSPHIHFQLSGSGEAGIGLLNPRHTWHISSSGAGVALYVDGLSTFAGNISSSFIPSADAAEGGTFTLGSSNKSWQYLYAHTLLGLDKTVGDRELGISSSVNVSGSVKPSTDDVFDLGTSGTQWKDLYLDGIGYIDQIGTGGDFTNLAYINSASINVLHLNVPGGNVSGSVIPMTDDTYDLGSSTYQWKDLYLDGIGYIDQIGTPNDKTSAAYITTLSASNAIINSASVDVMHYNNQTSNTSGSIIPVDNTTYNLGSNSKLWKEIHAHTLLGRDKTVGDRELNISSSVNVSGSVKPNADDVFDLGTSGTQWKDLYIDGIAYLDTIHTDEYIYHTGDTDTYIRFQDSQISLLTSGSGLIVSQSKVQIGGGIDGDTYIHTSTLNVTPHRYGGEDINSRNSTASIHVSGALTHLRLENLPTNYETAAAFGSGSLWRSGSTAGGHGHILAVV